MSKTVSWAILILLLVSALSLAFNIRSAKAELPTVYIRADGSIDPPTAPISTIDNVTYTFTGNINDLVVVERDNIVIDGAGYTVNGTGIYNYGNAYVGMDLTGISNVTIENMNIEAFPDGISGDASEPDQSGMMTRYTSYNSIIGNNITNNSNGIDFTSSHDNTISGNNITNNDGDGIRLWHSNNNSIIGNNITANGAGGIYLESSSNTIMSGNTIADSSEGVDIDWQDQEFQCLNNTITGNAFINDGLRADNSYGNVVIDNLVNGKPLVYLEDVSGYSVVGDAGQVILVGCSSINVENLTLSHADYGVELWGTSYTSISGCTIANITEIGIDFEYADYNTVSMNNIISNSLGIYLDVSESNTLYHNNFVKNPQQVGMYVSQSNVWDDGYPSGGNYWGDYNGKDLYSGQYQNMSGSDGIGDTPYVIDADNIDHYPLMKPYAGPTQLQPGETVYINSDGSVSPSNAPISSVDNVTYTFTGNISYPVYNGIVVESNNIVIDGNGYTVQGTLTQNGNGLSLTDMSNVTIKNTNIHGFQYGIYLDSSNNTTVSGNNATVFFGEGIYLVNSSNNIVSGNNVAASDRAISLNSCSNNTVSGNHATQSSWFDGDSIVLQSSENNTVSGNYATGNAYGVILESSSNDNTVSGNNAANNAVGIELESSSNNNTVSGNNATGCGTGIWLDSSSSNTVRGNSGYIELHSSLNNTVSGNNGGIDLYSSSNDTVSGNNGDGISLQTSSYNTVSGNNATASLHDGIDLFNSSYNTVSGNNATANAYDGIALTSSSNSNIVTGNNATANLDGIYLQSSSNNIVSGNNLTANSQGGIYISSSSGNVLSANVMEGNGYNFGVSGSALSDFMNSVDTSNLVNGKPVYYMTNKSNLVISPENYPDVGYLAIVNCTNMTVQRLTLTRDEEGILLAFTDDSKITDNNVANSIVGIYLKSSLNNTVNGNNATANKEEGILLNSSSNNIISGNNAAANLDGIYVDSSLYDTVSGNNVTANGDCGILLYSSPSNTVIGNDATANGDGISLEASSFNTVSGNNVKANSQEGIYISFSSYNTVSGNNATANGDCGILLYSSSYNTVSGNNVTANINDGIYLFGTYYDTVSGNNVTANGDGVSLYASSYNIFSGNTATANAVGIAVEDSSNNTIYHNNFIGNAFQVPSDSSPSTWDNGYPSGGNYWSDYNGTDLKSGQHQNVTGSDGIGDTPYVIDANSTDNYPLMGVFSDFNVAEGVDVQVVSNSTISDFQFNGTAVLFNVSGVNGTTGFCNVCVPTALLNGTLTVLVNRTQVQYSLLPISNSSNSYLYFTYGHSTEQVTIMPEFPESLILAIFMLATLLPIAIHKKKHSRSIQGQA